MTDYVISNNILVDYVSRRYKGSFDISVPRNQKVFYQLADGAEGFLDAGTHSLTPGRSNPVYGRRGFADLFWFNLNDKIEFELEDQFRLTDRLLKNVAPELNIFHQIECMASADITVRVEDCDKLLDVLFDRMSEGRASVINTTTIMELLKQKLHYLLEETVNRYKSSMEVGLFELSSLSECIEADLVNDLYSVLESMGLDLVAFHINRIKPTKSGIETYMTRESEMLDWYNQVQMDRFTKNTAKRGKKTAEPKRPVYARVS